MVDISIDYEDDTTNFIFYINRCMKSTNRLRHILLTIAVAIAANSCFAQGNFSLGIKGGIDIPNLSPNDAGYSPVSKGWSSRLGPYFGAVGVYNISQKFGLQAELNYSSQGGKKNGQQAMPVSYFTSNPPAGVRDYVYSNFNINVRVNYIELPVMARFCQPLGGRWQFIATAGPYIGYVVAAKLAIKGTSNIYADEAETTPLLPQAINATGDQDIKKDVRKFNFGAQGNIGVAVKMPLGNILLTAGGNYGFIRLQKNNSLGKNNIGAANFTVGYLVNL